MLVKIIAPIRNIIFEKHTTVSGKYVITNLRELKEDKLFRKMDFIEQFGGINTKIVYDNFIYYWEGESDEIDILNGNKSISDVAKHFSYNFDTVMNSFWFIRDHSGYIHETFGLETERYNAGTIYSLNGAFDSKGEQTPTHFSDLDFDQMIIIHSKVDDLLEREAALLHNHQVQNNLIQNPNQIYKTSRIRRVLGFLFNYRMTESPIERLANAMTLLEALFIARGTEDIGDRLKERVAVFLGGDINQKDSNKIIVKQAYNIRSRYLHGDTLTFAAQSVIELSGKIDELLRSVLNKVLTMNDNEIFIQVETKSNNKKFEEHFLNLIDTQTTPQ
jgi:hypothetical protein